MNSFVLVFLLATTVPLFPDSGAVVISVDSPEISQYLPPDAVSGFRAIVHRDSEQLKKLGYIVAPDELTRKFTIANFSKLFVDETQLSQRLIFPYKKLDLPDPGISNAGVFGIREFNSDFVDMSSYDTVIYVYSLENEGVVTVKKRDVSELPSRPLFYAEFLNYSVDGNVASVLHKKSSDGQVITTLSWYSSNYYFQITLKSNRSMDYQENFIKRIATNVR